MLATKEAIRQPNLNLEQISRCFSQACSSIVFFARKQQPQRTIQRIIEIAGGSGNGESKKSKWKKRKEERKKKNGGK